MWDGCWEGPWVGGTVGWRLLCCFKGSKMNIRKVVERERKWEGLTAYMVEEDMIGEG